jgi:non-homologous end joining protein Ku
MLRGKQAELPEQRLGQPLSDNVVNLMDALKRSLASEAPSNQSDIRKPTPRRPTQAAKRNRRSGSRTRSA